MNDFWTINVACYVAMLCSINTQSVAGIQQYYEFLLKFLHHEGAHHHGKLNFSSTFFENSSSETNMETQEKHFSF